MHYIKFKERIQKMPVFSSRDISFLNEDAQTMRNQIRRWQKKGLIKKLKKGLYILNDTDRKINPSRCFIANQLCSPSYVSLEYALSFYGIIPERVADITSITTRKTQKFSNSLGTFVYRHIKRECFSGFRKAEDEAGLAFFIAEPEKAVVDFLYFRKNLANFKKDLSAVLKESHRLQNISGLRQKRILEFARLFKNRKLEKLSREFCDFMRKER